MSPYFYFLIGIIVMIIFFAIYKLIELKHYYAWKKETEMKNNILLPEYTPY